MICFSHQYRSIHYLHIHENIKRTSQDIIINISSRFRSMHDEIMRPKQNSLDHQQKCEDHQQNMQTIKRNAKAETLTFLIVSTCPHIVS